MRGILLLPVLAVILVALHIPFLNLPFHWDELGQFVPASLDLYRDGAWVTHSTPPNVHPPGVMALLAAVWSVTGFSIESSRVTMLLVAALGVYFSFLLARRLALGAGAYVAIILLMAAPMFYTQSMMVLLDMPAMTFTVLALLLFLDARYAACAAACTLLVLVKETAITTPMVFGAWLLFRDRRSKPALYFFAPAITLGLWLVYLRQVTGSWFGNAEFASYNVGEAMMPAHILYALMRRVYTLFVADGHWIGAIALYTGWRMLRGRDWTVSFAVAGAQTAAVTLLGGAVLDRYLLPVLPILYAAFVACAAVYSRRTQWIAHAALAGLLVTGWFVNPPFPFPLENNLAVVDFVKLQRDASAFVASSLPGARIVSSWPFTAAVRNPDFGYVQTRIPARTRQNLRLADFEGLGLLPTDVIAVYSRGQTPPSWILENPQIRSLFAEFIDLQPEASAAELSRLGYTRRARWDRKGQWFEIYTQPTAWPQARRSE